MACKRDYILRRQNGVQLWDNSLRVLPFITIDSIADGSSWDQKIINVTYPAADTSRGETVRCWTYSVNGNAESQPICSGNSATVSGFSEGTYQVTVRLVAGNNELGRASASVEAISGPAFGCDSPQSCGINWAPSPLPFSQENDDWRQGAVKGRSFTGGQNFWQDVVYWNDEYRWYYGGPVISPAILKWNLQMFTVAWIKCPERGPPFDGLGLFISCWSRGTDYYNPNWTATLGGLELDAPAEPFTSTPNVSYFGGSTATSKHTVNYIDATDGVYAWSYSTPTAVANNKISLWQLNNENANTGFQGYYASYEFRMSISNGYLGDFTLQELPSEIDWEMAVYKKHWDYSLGAAFWTGYDHFNLASHFYIGGHEDADWHTFT